MNNETKLVFALEHVAHLEDLIEGNEWEQYAFEILWDANLFTLAKIITQFLFPHKNQYW